MKNTLDLLHLSAKIIESWGQTAASEIEKDLVLENLRRVYDEIKYTDRPVATADPGPKAAAEPEPSMPEPSSVPVVPETQITQNPDCSQGCQADAEPSSIVNSPDEKEEFAANFLFTEEQIPVKPKLDKKAILSLYGDEPMPVKKEENDPSAPEETTGPQNGQAQKPSQAVPQPQEPVQVLGEVIGGSGQTVGDVYSETNTATDVASVISSGRVEGIRKAIGINDKFLIIRNLFDSDQQAYESVMATLDGFDDLDDALIYIHENFSWNPDNEAVKLIVDLLTRKLS